MKFYQIISFTIILLLLSADSFSRRIRSTVLSRTHSKSKNKLQAKTKGFNVGVIFKTVDKYKEFSKTNFGAFMNGFFLGFLENLTAEKSQVQCTQDKFWLVLGCFVGGADKTLDQYYSDLPQFGTLPDQVESKIVDTDKGTQDMLKDPEVQKQLSQMNDTPKEEEKTIIGWLKAGWTAVKKTVTNIVETIKNKLTEWWNKAKMFFESPLIKGTIKLSKCISPIAFEEFKDPALKAVLTFLGVPFADKLKNIILNAPLIFNKLKDLFTELKTTITAKYNTPQQKYYAYGKATEHVIFTLHTIFTKARRFRRFRRLFHEKR